MSHRLTNADLEAYLDEGLTAEEMAQIEQEVRARPELLKRLAAIHGRRDAGVHSVGEIWRRQRLSCPPREQLGSFLLGALDEHHMAYVEFHLKTIGCRYCNSNLDDLRRQQEETVEVIECRRSKYFQSTAGHLRRKG
jgi:hypothetical protein